MSRGSDAGSIRETSLLLKGQSQLVYKGPVWRRVPGFSGRYPEAEIQEKTKPNWGTKTDCPKSPLTSLIALMKPLMSLTMRQIKGSSHVLVNVLQRNRTNRMCIYRERFILRNWLTWLWMLASPKSAGQAGKLETQGKQMLLQDSPLFWRDQSFSTKVFNWLDKTDPHDGRQSALVKATDLNVNLI